MRSVQFANKEVKVFYNSLIKEHQGLSSVINSLLKKDELKIIDITKDEKLNINIKADFGQTIVNIVVDFKINKIHVISPMGLYKETYENFPQNDAVPIKYEYINGSKIIIKQNHFNVEDGEINKYYYEFKDHNNGYNLLIIDKDSDFNEMDFIQKILYIKSPIGTIRELLMMILNDVNNKSLDIKICDEKGSIIEIDEGDVVNYNEVIEVNGEYQKIYLKNNEFYITKRVEELYKDNLTSYVKKIGECYGKEKR